MAIKINFVNNTKSLNMKYLNLTKIFASVAISSVIFTACDKAKVATPMGDAGQTLVKILGGGTPAALNCCIAARQNHLPNLRCLHFARMGWDIP